MGYVLRSIKFNEKRNAQNAHLQCSLPGESNIQLYWVTRKFLWVGVYNNNSNTTMGKEHLNMHLMLLYIQLDYVNAPHVCEHGILSYCVGSMQGVPQIPNIPGYASAGVGKQKQPSFQKFASEHHHHHHHFMYKTTTDQLTLAQLHVRL